ncbi:MAG TPA: glycoside hydrolase family 36 protein [Dehalococcoidia bacterium]|nr:glycoside hydrolase family 36 protein [Dehalococcoidia bacterium]
MTWFGGRPVLMQARTSRGRVDLLLPLEAGAQEATARSGIELRARVRDAAGRLAVEVDVTNTGARPVRVESVSPLIAWSTFGHGIVARAERAYRQGWQSWSPALSLSLRQYDVASRPPVEAPAESARALRRTGELRSDEVTVLTDVSGDSLLVGFETARRFVTQVRVDRARGLLEAVCWTDGVPLDPSETLRSERLVVDEAGGGLEQLERYADGVARAMGARTPGHAPTGWCSWYYYFTNVTEADVLANLAALQRLRRVLPLEWVQIDDGYQAEIGDWLRTNEKFPHGMAWLAREIREAGFRPGIWLAPFLLGERSQTYRERPDWVVRDVDGEPVLAMRNWGQRTFGLDGSRDDAVAWVRELFREVAEGWGYDYVKVDFLYGAALAGVRADPRVPRVEAYRRLLQAVREGVGRSRFVLGCGALMGASAGIVDGMRIGPDVAPWWRFQTKEEREGKARPRRNPARAPAGGEPATEAAVRNTMTRAWMHGRLWVNDPDCLLVRDDRTKLTLDEVRTLATVIALSGGMTLSSDDLTRLPPERLALLSMALPPLPRGASARDLMERSLPQIFEWRGRTPVEPAWLIAAVNWDDRARDLRVVLPEGEWTAFELWTQRLFPAVRGAVRLARVPAHGCRLLALRPQMSRPGFVGSTLHFGQGAVELAEETWEGETLRLRLRPTPQRQGEVFVAAAGLRARSAWAGRRRVAFRQRGDLVRVPVDLDGTRTLRIRFERRQSSSRSRP